MDTLRRYLNSLPVAEQHAFAARCGTTVGYMRKAISVGERFREGLVIAIERESGRKVTVEELRPDVDWAFIRGTAA
jgi:DNA-binding transcriptional regulator YdaS (Cro superfamily)